MPNWRRALFIDLVFLLKFSNPFLLHGERAYDFEQLPRVLASFGIADLLGNAWASYRAELEQYRTRKRRGVQLPVRPTGLRSASRLLSRDGRLPGGDPSPPSRHP